MGWKLFDGVAESEKKAHIRKATREYQAASRRPLLFQEHYEHGVNLPGTTPMPMLMSVGAADSEELAYAYGKHNAKEARSVGVRWVLNPIVDLTLNPQDPLIYTRSVGDDPERAVRLLTRQIAGIQENGRRRLCQDFPGRRGRLPSGLPEAQERVPERGPSAGHAFQSPPD